MVLFFQYENRFTRHLSFLKFAVLHNEEQKKKNLQITVLKAKFMADLKIKIEYKC
jgi:hypothetical protein